MQALIKEFNKEFNIIKKYLYDCTFIYIDVLGYEHSFTSTFTKDELLSAKIKGKIGPDDIKNLKVKRVVVEYLPITDEIFLRLIALFNRKLLETIKISGKTLKELKREILIECINNKNEIFYDVRNIIYEYYKPKYI